MAAGRGGQALPVEHDSVSGRNTTGHEWDGIRELDTPVPRPVFWFFALSLLFSAACWVLLPAFPYVTDYTRGLSGHSSREAVLSQVAEADMLRREAHSELLAASPEDLEAADGSRFDVRGAAALFNENCAMCHGRDLAGQEGFPDLTDSDWLWPNDVAGILVTLRYGINADHADTRFAEMPAYGRDGLLPWSDIQSVTEYVLQISGQFHDTEAALAGSAIFSEQCVSCHGEAGAGGLANGSPALSDDSWIYGRDRDSILDVLWHGRMGVMPAWDGRLDEVDLRKLALYVRGR